MTAEERNKWSKEFALKRRICLILKSPKIAFWRICGKPTQKMYIGIYKSKEVDLQTLLNEIVKCYEIDIEQKMVNMPNSERKTKLHNIHRYAEGRF